MRSMAAGVRAALLALAFTAACAVGEELGSADPVVEVPSTGGVMDAGTGGAMTAPPPPVPIATGGAPPASGGAPSEPGACSAGLKSCGGVCVAPSPTQGCSLTDCNPCPSPSAGATVVCRDGACVEEACTDCGMPEAGPMPPPLSPDAQRCLSRTMDNECTRCACTECLAQSLACGDSGQTARDEACLAIVECGRENHCTSIGCYCGTADLTTCSTAPAGACVGPIQSAAGSSDFQVVADGLANMNHAIYLADQVGQCALTSCAAPCGL